MKSSRLKTCLLVVLAPVIAACLLACHCPPVMADEPLVLEAGADHYLLAPHMEMLRDPDGRLQLAQAASPEMSGRFRRVTTPRTLRLGLTHDAVWLRFRLAYGPGAERCPLPGCPAAWYLELDNAQLDHIMLYVPLLREGYAETLAGQTIAQDEKPVQFRTYVLPIDGRYRQGEWIYLRLSSRHTMTTQFDIWSWRGLLRRVSSDTLFFGMVLGTLAAVTLYNLFVFLALWDRAYLYYVLYVISAFAYCLSTYGQMGQWFSPPPYLLPPLTWISVGSVYVFGSFFTRSFLRTWSNTPRWDWGLKALILGGFLVAALGALGLPHRAGLLAHLLALPTPVVVLICAGLIWRRGFRPARFFVLGWSILLTSFTMMGLKGVGLLPQALSHTYVMPSAIAAEAVLLSFALADRIRILRREKDEAQARERRYRELSLTDELTGLYNHRYLISRLASEVQHARQVDAPLSVALLDVDDFKAYNDRFGHLAGDQVLQSLARVMELHSRSADSVCRYGGEEFVVVMPGTGEAQGMAVAERIRKSFAGLSFRPQPGARAQVTVSVGVAGLAPGEVAMDILERADRALYRAKAAGKDRVET